MMAMDLAGHICQARSTHWSARILTQAPAPAPIILSPEAAIDALVALHGQAISALRQALDTFFDHGTPPSPETRLLFRYPQLRITYAPAGAMPANRRAFAKFQGPGVYATTITHPAAFSAYLLEQLRPLTSEYGATLEVGVGAQEIPYPYVLESGDELGRNGVSASDLARFFPVPMLTSVGDEIADGLWNGIPGEPQPLALFDAVRVDYSLRRLVHYTGSDWRNIQPWILLTNYHRYVDQLSAGGWSRCGPGVNSTG